MIYSLIICTVLYILIALVLTGMVHYSELNVTDPLAFVFERVGQHWISYIVSISAVVATTSVLLVFQLGQPRIWMSMSRDGLLPKAFGRIHPRFHTPSFSTIITGTHGGRSFIVHGKFVDDGSHKHRHSLRLCARVGRRAHVTENQHQREDPAGSNYPTSMGNILYLYSTRSSSIHSGYALINATQNFSHDQLQDILFLVFVIGAGYLTIMTFIRKVFTDSYSRSIVLLLSPHRDSRRFLEMVFCMDVSRIDNLLDLWIQKEQIGQASRPD